MQKSVITVQKSVTTVRKSVITVQKFVITVQKSVITVQSFVISVQKSVITVQKFITVQKSVIPNCTRNHAVTYTLTRWKIGRTINVLKYKYTAYKLADNFTTKDRSSYCVFTFPTFRKHLNS